MQSTVRRSPERARAQRRVGLGWVDDENACRTLPVEDCSPRLLSVVERGCGGLACCGRGRRPRRNRTCHSSTKSPGQGHASVRRAFAVESAVQRIVAAVAGTTGSASSRAPLEHFEASSRRVRCTSSGITRRARHSPARASAPITGWWTAVDVRPGVAARAIRSSRTFTSSSVRQQRRPLAAEPPQGGAGALHGLRRAATGPACRCRRFLDEAGVRPAGKWFLAEGADAAAMSRSIPIEKAWEDACAIYQNGERLRPETGTRCGSCCPAGKATRASSGCAG